MPLPRDVSTNPLVLAKTLKHLASFASMPHTTFEEQNARHLEPDATAARHHHADDAFSSMVRKLLRSNDSSSVRASNEAYLRFANGSCVGGVGMTVSYIRTALHFAIAYNLTFVHTPLARFTHGEDASIIEELLGFGAPYEDEHTRLRPGRARSCELQHDKRPPRVQAAICLGPVSLPGHPNSRA